MFLALSPAVATIPPLQLWPPTLAPRRRSKLAARLFTPHLQILLRQWVHRFGSQGRSLSSSSRKSLYVRVVSSRPVRNPQHYVEAEPLTSAARALADVLTRLEKLEHAVFSQNNNLPPSQETTSAITTSTLNNGGTAWGLLEGIATTPSSALSLQTPNVSHQAQHSLFPVALPGKACMQSVTLTYDTMKEIPWNGTQQHVTAQLVLRGFQSYL